MHPACTLVENVLCMWRLSALLSGGVVLGINAFPAHAIGSEKISVDVDVFSASVLVDNTSSPPDNVFSKRALVDNILSTHNGVFSAIVLVDNASSTHVLAQPSLQTQTFPGVSLVKTVGRQVPHVAVLHTTQSLPATHCRPGVRQCTHSTWCSLGWSGWGVWVSVCICI